MNFGNRKIGLRRAADARLGRELFAREHIKKGEVALQSDGVVIENGIARIPDSLLLWCYDFDDTHTFCPVDSQHPSIEWFFNHSCSPNIGSSGDPFRHIAMLDIFTGEAITCDYAMIDSAPPEEWTMECFCSASNCRKVITANGWKIPELQERYKGYFLKNIQAKIDALRRTGHRAELAGA